MNTDASPPTGRTALPRLPRLFLLLLLCLGAAMAETKSFDIPAGPAVDSLKKFTIQSGDSDRLLYSSTMLDGISTNSVKGRFEAFEALQQMLTGTGLVAVRDAKTGAFAVRKETPAESKNAARATPASRGRPLTRDGKVEADEGGEKVIKMDTFEVFAGRTLNMDISRSRDDALPYVVFNRTDIQQSGATSVEDFLKQRLTMNTQDVSASQFPGNGNSSKINLRGLGTNQTLILVDGHRRASAAINGSPQQPDLNGIPLSAIERIEVLPATASGIYGGGATGGVVNVILRRGYSGTEAAVAYENTFDTDAAIRRISLSSGITSRDGNTSILLAASYSDQNALALKDRDFVQRGRASILANNAGFLFNSVFPPLGTTPNIRSSNGANLVLKNGTPLNSPRTYIPAGYAGIASDGGNALVANAGKYNLGLADSAQSYSVGGSGGRRVLTESPTVASLSLTIRQQFTPSLQGFVEAFASNNSTSFPASSVSSGGYTIPGFVATNPFLQTIRVVVPSASLDTESSTTLYTRRVVGGFLFKLPADWKGELDYTWERARFWFVGPAGNSATAAVATGALDVLRDTSTYPVDFSGFVSPPANSSPPNYTDFGDATARFSGPLFALDAGRINLSTLIEHRREQADAVINTLGSYGARRQVTDSAYLEATIPLISGANRRSGVEDLSIQIALRGDRYKTIGAGDTATASGTIPSAANRMSSLDPTVAVRYRPAKMITLRASYGTGFVPPAVNQLVPTALDTADYGIPLGFLLGVTDPKRGNEFPTSFGLWTQSGNPELRPEESESRSAGMVIEPLDGLRISVDWTRITKTNNIITPEPQDIVDLESDFPERVTRGPAVAGDGFAVGPIIGIDTTLLNIATGLVEAYDVQLDYEWKTRSVGSISLFCAATWQTHFKTRILPGNPMVEHVGFSSTYPLKFRGNAGITWSSDHWRMSWFSRYYDSYLAADSYSAANTAILLNQGNGGRVPSQVYHDVSVSYRTGPSAGSTLSSWIGDTEVQVGIKNVFNTVPPLDTRNSTSLSTYYSYFGSPRLASYYIELKRSF